MINKKIELYISNYCPFCVKVIHFLDVKKVELPIVNISQSNTARQDLIEKGGKSQTPCLMIDNEALYESDDIISWLGTHYVN